MHVTDRATRGKWVSSTASRSKLGVALHAQGKLTEAVAEFRAAIRFKPDDPSAHYGLGITLKAQGKLAEAVAEFRKARDNAAQGDSELAQLIDRALTATDH